MNKPDCSVSRREFLAGSIGAAALTIVPAHVLGGEGRTAPSERVTLAGVGVGGVGFGHLQECDKQGFQLVALCDVDHAYAKKAFDRWPQARRYKDFREMLQAEGDRADAVYCGTPDHTHAIVTLAALRQKKHVCCVKPLTRTVEECRAVVAESARARVATQVTAAPNTNEWACRTCELIWAGAIGPVREVHVWSDRPLWPQGMVRPAGADPIPKDLDWDMWLGPAPKRPFKANWPDGDIALRQVNMPGGVDPWYRSVYHPFNFRGWWDFGTGALGDMGCHYLNTPFKALKLTSPAHVHATSTRLMGESAPLASVVTFEFPAREDMPPLRMVWYDGGLRPPVPRQMIGRSLGEGGAIFIGDEGAMIGPNVLPAERGRKFDTVPKTLQRRSGTFGEWLEACKGGPAAGCAFEWAGPLTECILLGNIAIRRGKPLDWNGPGMKFTNDADANRLLSADYHNGWSLKQG